MPVSVFLKKLCVLGSKKDKVYVELCAAFIIVCIAVFSC